MFLAERLFGITVYLGVLLVICYLIIRTKPTATKRLLASYLVCISVMGFFYVPAIEADLYRLIEYMSNYAAIPVDGLMTALLETSTPGTLLYLRVIGLTGITGLLAGLTAFIVFGNIFYIIRNYASRINSSSKAIALSLFTVMSTGIFMQTIGGIRNMLAFSILARCFYDEICNDKKVSRNIGWYIIACLIHPAAIAAVALRLLSLLHYKLNTVHVKSLIAIVVASSVIGWLILRPETSIYLDNAVDKFESYAAGASYTYLWDNIITVLTIALILLNYKLVSYGHRSNKDNLQWLIRLSVVMTVFSLVFFFEHAIFVRFTQLNLIIMLPVIISNATVKSARTAARGSSVIVAQKLTLYLPLLILIISASRGALSSLKFFVL